jgi:hypothetical protein
MNKHEKLRKRKIWKTMKNEKHNEKYINRMKQIMKNNEA